MKQQDLIPNRSLPNKRIGTASSIFLDVLRLGAALTVLLVHAHNMWFPWKAHNPSSPGDASHTAVVIFFVLSGYVIAYTTSSNNRGPLHYAQARLSRLYSVVIPALLLTAMVEMLIQSGSLELRSEFTRGLSWPRYLLTAGFLNEIWFFSAAPPLNGPLWSLSFEFWYYLIFGLWYFRKPGWKNLILPFAACVIAGPKILLLMPVWLLGCAAYRIPRSKISGTMSWFLVFMVIGITTLTVLFLPPLPWGIGAKPLFFSGQFISDWLVGALLALALWLLPSGKVQLKPHPMVTRFRSIADLTFPIYVLHNPLLGLWRYAFGHREGDAIQLWVAIISVILVSALIGHYLEKQRPAWSQFFKKLLELNKLRLIKLLPHLKTSNKPT